MFPQSEGRRVLKQANLDILVFADQMSEPHSYSYSFGRFAAVQVSARVLVTCAPGRGG